MAAINLTAALLAALGARPLLAGTIESFWNDPGGGPFDDPANWKGPVPDETVTAIFDLDATYYVTFLYSDAVSDRFVVRDGHVNLWLGSFDGSDPRTYDSLSPSFLAPSVVVGETIVGNPEVTIIGGVLSSRHTIIGLAPGAAGTVQFWRPSDPVPALVCQDHLHVGYGGQGTLVVDDGATVTCTDAVLGSTGSGVGQVSVSGHGAALDCSGTLALGKAGQGALSVADGGDVFSASAVVGQQDGSSGGVTIAGAGSTWVIANGLDVGMEGVGTVTISNGGALFNQGFATMGTLPPLPWNGPGGNGEVTVTGPASVWLNDGDLYVGFLWTAALYVLEGAAVTSRSGQVGPDPYYYYGDRPEALADIRGVGSVWSVGDSLEVYSTLSVANGGLVIAETIEIEEGAEVTGDGTLVGDVFDSGIVRPGDAVGTLSIDGSFFQDGSAQMLVELAGAAPGGFGALAVSGVASLGGDLGVSLAPGYAPQRGDAFPIVTAGTLGGVFGALELPVLRPPLTWRAVYDAQTFKLLVVDSGDLDGNGSVGITDFLLLLGAWGPCPPGQCAADLDGDGAVGPTDLLILLENWS